MQSGCLLVSSVFSGLLVKQLLFWSFNRTLLLLYIFLLVLYVCLLLLEVVVSAKC